MLGCLCGERHHTPWIAHWKGSVMRLTNNISGYLQLEGDMEGPFLPVLLASWLGDVRYFTATSESLALPLLLLKVLL